MTEKNPTAPVEKKKEKSWRHYFKIGTTAFCTIAASIMFFFILFRYEEISAQIAIITESAQPIVIGLVLAYLLMPVMDFVEKPVYRFLIAKKVSEKMAKSIARGIGITGAIVFLFAVIGVLVASFVPALITSVKGLMDTLPDYIASFVAWVTETGLMDSEVAVFMGEYMTSVTSEVENWARGELLPLAQQYIAQITSGVFAIAKTLLNFIIGIIVMTYVMSIREKLVGQSKKVIYAIFSAKTGNTIINTVRKSNKIFGGFVIGKIIDSFIIGIIAYIGCLIMKTPSALLVAFIIGITNVIPFFGPFIGAIPSILLVLIQSPIHGLYLAIFILILQQVDGNIIGPKILGDTTGLSSFWVLFSLLVAGGLFGFAGMLLGVPVFAVIYYILQQLLEYQMQKKALPIETDEYIHLMYVDEEDNSIKYDIEKEETEEIKK